MHRPVARKIQVVLCLAVAAWLLYSVESAMAERRLIREEGKEISATVTIAGSRLAGISFYMFSPPEGGMQSGYGEFSGAAFPSEGATIRIVYLPGNPDRNFALESDPPHRLWWRVCVGALFAVCLARCAGACLSEARRDALRPKLPRWLGQLLLDWA